MAAEQQSLIVLMLLPVGIGLFVKARRGRLSESVKPFLDGLSNISLVLLILLISIVNFDKVLQVFGTRGMLAGLLFIALGCLTGWLFGGPGDDTRRSLALGTGPRNIAAALVVESQSFTDPGVTVMVLVVAIVGFSR